MNKNISTSLIRKKKIFPLTKMHFPKWEPENFNFDFKNAAILARKKTFPESNLTACNFHFN